MANDSERVYPTGLTIKEAEELHSHVIDGSRIFFLIAVVAHTLAYLWSPWMH
jgi:light-harvesting protein B-800-850 beta chain